VLLFQTFPLAAAACCCAQLLGLTSGRNCAAEHCPALALLPIFGYSCHAHQPARCFLHSQCSTVLLLLLLLLHRLPQ
jgi:hypothetical protein